MSALGNLILDPDNPLTVGFNVLQPLPGELSLIRKGTRLILIKRFCGNSHSIGTEWFIGGFAKNGNIITKPLKTRGINEDRIVTLKVFKEHFKVLGCRPENQHNRVS